MARTRSVPGPPRGPRKDVVCGRVPPELRALLAERAARDGVTLSLAVCDVLMEAMGVAPLPPEAQEAADA